MAKIYTKTGDSGFTSLTGGKRVKKNNKQVEAYGTIDEVNSLIGLAISKLEGIELEQLKAMLVNIQHDLFHVGAELSTTKGEKVYWPLQNSQITALENYIDQLDGELPKLNNFILPGGSEEGAVLHLARTVVRRAERLAVSVDNSIVNSYLNRLSDFLFVSARWVNYKLGTEENSFQVGR